MSVPERVRLAEIEAVREAHALARMRWPRWPPTADFRVSGTVGGLDRLIEMQHGTRRALATPWFLIAHLLACGPGASGRSDGLHDPGIDTAGRDVDDVDDPDDDDGSPGNGCSTEERERFDFSFLWVANSPEGTVSKIDTLTGLEVARYRTGPGTPDPSRTSVNLEGDVAVANRAGSVVKFAARLERCVDRDGDGTIRTSSGPDDVLEWNEDECMLWYRDLAEPEHGAWGPRPIAWDGGPFNPDRGCQPQGARVWVGWYTGVEDNHGVFVRLDGTTGAVLDEVEVEAWTALPMNHTRPYGGATNRRGDLWVLGKHRELVRIDAQTLEVERHVAAGLVSFYGLALDAEGQPWIAGCDGAVYHFTGHGIQSVAKVDGCLRGLQIDRQKRAWIAANDPCRLVLFDTETQSVVDEHIPLPGCSEPVGVSIDVEGNVWVVDRGSDTAFKVDPESRTVSSTTTGLVSPYTYSDMTGAGLDLVWQPEG